MQIEGASPTEQLRNAVPLQYSWLQNVTGQTMDLTGQGKQRAFGDKLIPWEFDQRDQLAILQQLPLPVANAS